MKKARIGKMAMLGIVIFLISFSAYILYCHSAIGAKERIIGGIKGKVVGFSRNVKSWVLYDKRYERDTRCANICLENLCRIDKAKEEWALENKKQEGCQPKIDDLIVYMRAWPECPNGGYYIINPIGQNPLCSLEGEALSLYPKDFILWDRVIIFGIIAFLLIFLLFLNFIPFGRRIRDKIDILNLGKRIIRGPTA